MAEEVKIAVLGLGIIGGAWARHFEEDGRLAATWNRTAKSDFPKWVKEPEAAVEKARAVLIVLADPAAVQAVLNRILPRLGRDHLVIQSTTIDPASSARFEAQVKARGGTYLEAPFTGSKPAAEARQVVYYLGGDQSAMEAAEPFLAPISSARLAIGSCAQAAALKLAMNLQIAVQAGALCESLALAREAGIADSIFFGALRKNAACSGVTALKEPKLRDGDYSPQFSVKHMLKDMRLLLGPERSSSLPLAGEIEQVLSKTAEAGHAEEDFIAMMKSLES